MLWNAGTQLVFLEVTVGRPGCAEISGGFCIRGVQLKFGPEQLN